jgi:hypothetical protein
MSEELDRINAAPDARRKVNNRSKRVAPAIRALKDKYPAMPVSVIAAKVGCTPQNVRGVLSSYLAGTSEEALREYQDNRGDILDAVQHRALLSITQAKLDKSSPAELMTVFGISYDKARLERGQATGINVSVLLDVAEAIREKQRGTAREQNANVIEG